MPAVYHVCEGSVIIGGSDCVALITARGGSKRIPGKNTRPLCGRPLIGWTIEEALAVKRLRRVIVSTDCHEIAAASREAGAEIPYIRPAALSGDHSSHYDVIAHALDQLEKEEGRLPKLLCLLQPTSPLRSAADIDATIKLVESTNADCGFSASRATSHPALLYRLERGRAQPYLPPQTAYLRSQDLEPLYQINGAVYVLRPASFRRRRTLLSGDPVVHVMPWERSVDVDEEYDLIVAEALLRARRNS